MRNITFELATESDDAALCRILHDNPFPGSISVSSEREPSFFRAAVIEGAFHQIVIARDQTTGEIVGMGSRSIRPVYLNGQVQNVGYLSQVRFTAGFRQGLYFARGLMRGMQFFHELHRDGRASFYFSSIIADNLPAQRLFLSGRAGMPTFHEYAQMLTYAVAARKPKPDLPLASGLKLTRGSEEYLPQIVECLQRNGTRRQFAPYWDIESLCNPACTSDLSPSDFFIALDGERVVGCIACWNQMRLKQSVVRGYSNFWRYSRFVVSLAARFVGLPELPAINESLRYSFASHIAIDDDEPLVFSALLRALHNHIAKQRDTTFMIGFSAQNPLRTVFTRAYPHLTYPSKLYLVAWQDEQSAIAQIDARVPGFEIAVL